jgi:hypothetical protein
MLKKSFIVAMALTTMTVANSEVFSKEDACPKGQKLCNAKYGCYSEPTGQLFHVGTVSVPICTALSSCDNLMISDVTHVVGNADDSPTAIKKTLEKACHEDLAAQCEKGCYLPQTGNLTTADFQ